MCIRGLDVPFANEAAVRPVLRSLRWRGVLTLLLLVGITSNVAHAQSPSELVAARAWFDEGLSLEERGSWAEALDRFTRVASVKRTPQVTFHFGLCQVHLGRLVEAMDSFSLSAADARQLHIAGVEEAASRELAVVRDRVPKVRVTWSSLPGGEPTKVTVDGVLVAAPVLREAIVVNPGRHKVAAIYGEAEVVKEVDVAEAAEATVAFEAPAALRISAPPARGVATHLPRSDHMAEPNRGRRTLGWVLVTAGGVALAGSVTMWALRVGKLSNVDAACAGQPKCPLFAKGDYDAAKVDTILSVSLAGVAAAVGAAGVYFLVTPPSPGTQTSDHRARISSYGIAPFVARGAAGVAVGGAF